MQEEEGAAKRVPCCAQRSFGQSTRAGAGLGDSFDKLTIRFFQPSPVSNIWWRSFHPSVPHVCRSSNAQINPITNAVQSVFCTSSPPSIVSLEPRRRSTRPMNISSRCTSFLQLHRILTTVPATSFQNPELAVDPGKSSLNNHCEFISHALVQYCSCAVNEQQRDGRVGPRTKHGGEVDLADSPW
jgi:hypothetical protein